MTMSFIPAIKCPEHGHVVLTDEQYDAHMDQPNIPWACPLCGRKSEWDERNY